LRDLYRRSQDRTHYAHDRDNDRIIDRSIDKDGLERSTHRHFEAAQGKQFLRSGTPMLPVSEGQEIARHNRDRNRGSGRPGIAPGATPPQQNAPAEVAGGLGIGRMELPQFGSGPRGQGQRDASQMLNQAGAGRDQDAQNSTTQLPPNVPARGPRRSFFRPNPRAVGTAGMPSPPNIPSTDISRDVQSPPVPGVAVPLAPQVGYRVPGADAGRAFPRGYGLNAAPRASAPAAVLGVAPTPMPSPAANVRIQVAPPMPAVQPVPAAPSQAVPQIAPQRGGPRSGMGFGGS
jgi:hypothetical protein